MLQSHVTIQNKFLYPGLALGSKEPGQVGLEEVEPAKPHGTGLALGYRGSCSKSQPCNAYVQQDELSPQIP